MNTLFGCVLVQIFVFVYDDFYHPLSTSDATAGRVLGIKLLRDQWQSLV